MRTMANTLPSPVDDECIRCYLERTFEIASCDGTLRAIKRYQENSTGQVLAPLSARELDLDSRIKKAGIYCDCEFRMNQTRLEETAQRDTQNHLICSGNAHPRSVAGCANWVELGP